MDVGDALHSCHVAGQAREMRRDDCFRVVGNDGPNIVAPHVQRDGVNVS
jgi:hypothetical protein